MATAEVTPTEVIVHLSGIETLAAFRRDVHVPRETVVAVRVVDEPILLCPGLRAPGSAVPGRRAGVFYGHRGKYLVAAVRGRAGVEITLDGARYERIVLSLDVPEEFAASLRRVCRQEVATQ